MFLILQNDPQCPAGTVSELLSLCSHRYRCLEAFGAEELPDPAGYTGIIVLGGEMGVHDTVRHPYLVAVVSFLRRALETGTPLLGICLGGQLLAHAAGGTVSSPSPHGEHGVCRVELTPSGAADPLFHGVPDPFVTFQLHNDSFTTPPGAVLLARSAVCPAQAFRLGEAAYGVQFHPEVDPAIVAAWDGFSTPATDHLTAFLASKAAFDAASRALIGNFFALAASLRLP